MAETEEAVRCTAVTKEFGTREFGAGGIVRALDAVDLALRAGGCETSRPGQCLVSDPRETGKSK